MKQLSKPATVIILAAAVMIVCGCAGSAQLEQKKRNAAIARDLGDAYLNQGNASAALRELLKAEKLNPDDYLTQNSLGLAYMMKKHYAQAIKHFKRAIELKPDYSPAKNNLGALYLAMENWDAAIEILTQVTKDLLYATPHFPLTNLGYAYFKKGDYAKAESYYKQALEIEPNYPLALQGLARIYMKTGRPAKAAVYLRRLVKLAPKHPGFHLLLAKALHRAGNLKEAWRVYGKVIALAPDSPQAREAEKAMASMR